MSQVKFEPIPIVLDDGTPKKINGFIMRITTQGMLVELDAITFKVGGYLTANFSIKGADSYVERVRSIKNYDKFYRVAPKKKLKKGEVQPPPKKLAEFHFQMLTEACRTAITKFIIKQQFEEYIKE